MSKVDWDLVAEAFNWWCGMEKVKVHAEVLEAGTIYEDEEGITLGRRNLARACEMKARESKRSGAFRFQAALLRSGL